MPGSQPDSPTKANDGNTDLLLRLNAHQRARKCSEALLDKARADPSRWRGMKTYDSKLRRLQMQEKFEEESNGLIAKVWQLDIGEALDLNLDVTAIVKTGAGKTVTCALPPSGKRIFCEQTCSGLTPIFGYNRCN